MADTEKKLSGMKKAMARQMAKSWEAPQFHLDTAVDCAALIAYRKSLPFKTSYTTILVKVIAEVLANYPDLNSSWNETNIIEHSAVNMGIAVDTKRGLVVPVIPDAGSKSLEELHAAMESIKEKGKTGMFRMEDLADGTFVISNLGMYNVTSFTAVVNAPNAAILSVGKMADVPMVRNGQLVAGKQMYIGLSGDHRVTDGATGAKFLTELAQRLETL